MLPYYNINLYIAFSFLRCTVTKLLGQVEFDSSFVNTINKEDKSHVWQKRVLLPHSMVLSDKKARIAVTQFRTWTLTRPKPLRKTYRKLHKT
jgi:hypothetical protein